MNWDFVCKSALDPGNSQQVFSISTTNWNLLCTVASSRIPSGGPGSSHMLCVCSREEAGSSSTAINKTVVLCHLVGGRLLLPSKHRHPPVGGMPWPWEAKGAKEAINLLCFMDPTLKSKNDYIHNTYRIPKKNPKKTKGSEKWKRKIRYRICCLYPCVTTITTQVHCLEIQASQYFCFIKLVSLIPSPAVAQPGILYYSFDLY